MDFINFFEIIKITKENLPHNKIKDEFRFNNQYENILNSLADNYKSNFNDSIKNITYNNNFNGDMLKNSYLIKNESFEVFNLSNLNLILNN